MKSILPLSLLALVLFSCNTHPTGNTTALTENSLYNIDSIRAAGEGNVQAGQKKLLQAIDVYINGKDAAKSIALFKIAIKMQPSPKAYFQLGSALADNGNYDEAAKALHIAEKLGYSPLANVMFKLAEAYSLRPSDTEHTRDSHALHYMEIALQMGYAHPEAFLKADFFENIRSSFLFNSTYNNALAGGMGNGSPEKILWERFKSEFHPVEFPLTINTVWIQGHKFDNPVDYDYEKFIPELRNAKFSREVDKEFFYFAQIRKDTAYTALLYAGKNEFVEDASHYSPVFFMLTTYDRNGKIIDKMQVAGQSTFTDIFQVMTMQPNYTFIIKDYKNIYKQDPAEAGYDSNYVVRSEPLGTAAYRIAANGKFEKTDAPLAMR